MASNAFQQAVLLFQQGRPADAEKCLLPYLQRNPRDPDALHLGAILAQETGRPQRAVTLIGKAIAAAPRSAAPYDVLASALHELGRHREALAACDKAIALDPRFAEAFVNRGNVLLALGQAEEAVTSHDRAIAIAPGFAEAHFNRALALAAVGRAEEALGACERAVQLQPNLREAHFTRGTLLFDRKMYQDALTCFAHVLALKPDHAEAHYNIGNVCLARHEYETAIGSYGRAIGFKPDHAGALLNRGVAQFELGRYDEALASYNATLKLVPDRPFLYGDAFQVELTLCQWAGFHTKLRTLSDRIARGEKVCDPFTSLSVLDDPALQLKAAAIYAAEKYAGPMLPLPRRDPGDKIRLGYFSADFRQHPVADLIVELLERHDRDRFHVTGFAFGPDTTDDTTRRVAAAVDEFIDIRALSDADTVALARERRIDIAVDLGGYTKHARPGIFAGRAAPAQVSYIGFLGTMGVETTDYLIADRTLVPDAEVPHYAEKIIRLPSYQANPRERPVASVPVTRRSFGLPDTGFVFCCFNNTFKILPDTFARWVRIVRQVPGSVLWLYASNPTAADNLRAIATGLGLEPERLILAGRVERSAYLARLGLADLFLDTAPYNAGTTASDALWMGVPVLTLPGRTFASRMAASVLTAMAMPDLIADTPEEYEQIALTLATDADKHAVVKHRLAENRATARLFDTQRFARDIETAYGMAMDRYRSGLEPDHIVVPD